MRLIATTDFTFHGIEIRLGQIFDATEEQARDLINKDLAHRFHLEDPGHPPPVIEPPVEPPPPAVVSLSPDVAPASADGDTGSVIAHYPPTPGTWVVDPDPAGGMAHLYSHHAPIGGRHGGLDRGSQYDGRGAGSRPPR